MFNHFSFKCLCGIGGPGLGGMIVAGFASAIGARTASLIGDKVNNRAYDFRKANISGITAGVFSLFGNGVGNYLSINIAENSALFIINSVSSQIFSSYTFISDFLYDKFRRK